MTDKALSSSLEDYIEAIYQISKKKLVAHANQIAEYLGVSKSSVSWALNQLSRKKLINYTPYEVVTLTDKGKTVAKRVAGRHEDIKNFLVEVLGIKKEMAESNACRMEHVMDKEVLGRMRLFLNFLEQCPQAKNESTRPFIKFCAEDGKK